MSAAPSQLQRLRDVEAGIRVVRWLGVAFAIVQIGVLYAPPEGVSVPWPRIPVAVVLAGVLVLQNVISRAIEQRADLRTLRTAGNIQTAVDLVLVIAIVALYAFDTESRLWPLLVLPLLEGAMREQVRGAVAVAAGGVLADIIIFVGPYEPLELLSSMAFQAGILFIVAFATGSLAARFEDARTVAEGQAERLRHLAELARDLPTRRATDEVFDRVVDVACELTSAQACEVHTREAGAWIRRAREGLDDDTSLLDRLLLTEGRPPDHPVVLPASRDLEQLLAVPIVTLGDTSGMILLARPSNGRPFTSDDRDVVQLLAGHAGAALDAARTIEELEALDAVKDEFLHILAHELRSPMTALTGYATLLRRRWTTLDPIRREEFLEAVERGTERMAKLLRDVQDVSEADRHSLPVRREPFELRALIERIAREEVEHCADHRLELDVGEDPVTVYADPDRVTQVAVNLISNAVKYSPSGGRIRVEVSADEDEATVTVTDDGFGIPRQLRGHLFQKFSRLPTPQRVSGTGLGLYLSRMLVEAMGGTIGVTSEEGRGSTFHFTIPLEQPVTPDPGAAPARSVEPAEVVDVTGGHHQRSLPAADQ